MTSSPPVADAARVESIERPGLAPTTWRYKGGRKRGKGRGPTGERLATIGRVREKLHQRSAAAASGASHPAEPRRWHRGWAKGGTQAKPSEAQAGYGGSSSFSKSGHRKS